MFLFLLIILTYLILLNIFIFFIQFLLKNKNIQNYFYSDFILTIIASSGLYSISQIEYTGIIGLLL